MNYDPRTREGFTNLVNTIVAILTLLAANYFGWDSPAPAPAPDVTIVATESPAAAAADEPPEYSITGFASRQQADQAADLITQGAATPAGPGPVTGFSVAFFLALLNLISQYFGPFKS